MLAPPRPLPGSPQAVFSDHSQPQRVWDAHIEAFIAQRSGGAGWPTLFTNPTPRASGDLPVRPHKHPFLFQEEPSWAGVPLVHQPQARAARPVSLARGGPPLTLTVIFPGLFHALGSPVSSLTSGLGSGTTDSNSHGSRASHATVNRGA